ncbi:MAG: tryptophan--tRNA ligase [Saprospiraceae bacterium]|nr:tryptophan--tRNA ligase [Saprospiraceae bacterium]
MKTILSCIQPTGDLHLGNYFGAVNNWVEHQKSYKCFYGVVDYHSMTMPYNPKKLRENTWNMIFQLLACGVNIENLFIQSLVPEHVELSWVLSCTCSYGELTRMTQFKDKTDQLKSVDKDAFISNGLFSYPVLQAADILIYKADFVPVGKDQEQHLELSRDIAERFNYQFGKTYFVCPQPLYTNIPKLLSPADPTKKMSKSLGEKHYINVFGDIERVKKQIRSAVTDSGETPSDQMSAGVSNLFELLKATNNKDQYDDLMSKYANNTLKYSELKEVVAEALVSFLTPFQEKYNEILADKKVVKDQILQSSQEIRKVAQNTMSEIRAITGLGNLKY